MSAVDLLHLFDDRWEQDRLAHSYYLDTAAYRKLSTVAKHVVIKGHRGTGKTTLMRALDWRERLNNLHLRRALGDEPFSDRVVGCFLQIKLMPVEMIDIWTRDSNEQVQHVLIASYLRATWLLEICAALRGINERTVISGYAEQIEDLKSAARDVWRWMPERLRLRPGVSSDVLSLGDVEALARALLANLRSAAAIEAPRPEGLVSELSLLEFGEIVDKLFRALAKYVGRLDQGANWSFRICMDEGEFLSDSWATCVRTLIRETDAPVYLAVSVLHSLGSATRSAKVPISLDDREVISLDDRSPEQMAGMLNGILRARFSSVGESAAFDIKLILGNPDVDDLFTAALQRSERKAASTHRIGSDGGASFVRAHLIEIGAVSANEFRDRRSESAGYRKKKVAGYLHLLGSLGIERPFYAGWRVAVNMADNSVRDFIRFLRYCLEVWARNSEEIATADIRRFLRQPRIDFAIQDAALNSLGASKLEAMPNTVVRPNQTKALVLLLGEVSHRSDFHNRSLRQPNATRLLLPIRREGLAFSADDTRLIGLLEEAASYGYVADLDIGRDRVTCRVNRSFARHLGFSYWKPQYLHPVSAESLRDAMARPGSSPASWLRASRPRAAVRGEEPLFKSDFGLFG